MKIGLSGAQSVGKTTILEELRKIPELKDFKFINEIVRNIVKEYQVDINETSTDETQLLVANTHYFNSFKENIITDRCILDCFIYTYHTYLHSSKISGWVFYYITDLLKHTIDKFDHIFYFPPEFDIKKDNFRSPSKKYQKQIHELFLEVIKSKNIMNESNNIKNVHIITGTVEERIDKIKQILKI